MSKMWPEVETADKEKRRELVLKGKQIQAFVLFNTPLEDFRGTKVVGCGQILNFDLKKKIFCGGIIFSRDDFSWVGGGGTLL